MPPRADGEPHEHRRPTRHQCLAGVALISGLSLTVVVRAQQVADAAPAAQPASNAPRTFDLNEFIVRGNTKLQSIDIEKAVYPFEGPGKTIDDVNAARDALQKTYQDKGYQSVVVELPQQQVKDGVIVLQVVEAKVGRLDRKSVV